jgi:3-oxoacyl-[acyl-carrier protein] reductase
MDLGIKGKRALVTAGPRDWGAAAPMALAGSRRRSGDERARCRGLEETAAEIREAHTVSVATVAGDITLLKGRAAVLAAGPVDILVTNAGGPPPGMWSDWSRDDFIKAIDANMLTPIALMQATVAGDDRRGWGRVVNITSQSVKSPIPQLGLSNAARAGLTGFVGGTSRQVAPHGVTINNLLPGIHDTDRATALDMAAWSRRAASRWTRRSRRWPTIPARRYGTAAEFGAMCLSVQPACGFIVGQNILLGWRRDERHAVSRRPCPGGPCAARKILIKSARIARDRSRSPPCRAGPRAAGLAGSGWWMTCRCRSRRGR